MAVKKKQRRNRRWKTGALHWPGSHHEHEENAAQRLTPLEETDAFKDSPQKDTTHAPDDTIRVDSASVQMPENFVEDEREGASIFRLEPVALVLLLIMLAFIVFVAWQISLMPNK